MIEKRTFYLLSLFIFLLSLDIAINEITYISVIIGFVLIPMIVKSMKRILLLPSPIQLERFREQNVKMRKELENAEGKEDLKING